MARGTTENDDVLNGTECNNSISGLGGNDVIRGSAGDDTLIGGDGADNISESEGNNDVQGGIGNDTIFASGQIDGSAGDDGLRHVFADGIADATVLDSDGTDGTGASGLQDRVNYHWGRVFLAAGLATILNLDLESGADSEDDVASAIREAAQDTIGRTGDEIVRQQLAVPPTLTIRPGFPVRVMVTRDLILEPLGEAR